MEVEYAPQYSSKERWKLLALVVVPVLLLYGVWQWWGLPQFRLFAETAHCRRVLGAPATAVLVYGLFIGLPLMTALLFGVFVVPMAVRAIRTRCYPPPGQKVLGRVKVRRGRGAILVASVTIGLVACLCGLAVWGGFKAGDILQSVTKQRTQSAQAACRSNAHPSSERANP